MDNGPLSLEAHDVFHLAQHGIQLHERVRTRGRGYGALLGIGDANAEQKAD